MKKLLKSLLVTSLLLVPIFGKAASEINVADYETKGLIDTLKEENLDPEFEDYKETEDQVIIYLFRGTGCNYCRKFITYLNSITKEYGSKFRLVSFETWNNEENAALYREIGEFMEADASGVPFIIIGEQYFPGYAESYNEAIIKAIEDLYEIDKDNRYDVFDAYNYEIIQRERAARREAMRPILWNLLFVAMGTLVICLVVIAEGTKIRLALVEGNEEKTTTKKKKSSKKESDEDEEKEDKEEEK